MTPNLEAQKTAGPSWRVPAICLALAVLTLAVFGQTLTHGFIDYDDNDYVYENPVVAQGLTARGAVWAFTTYHANNWHPLTWLSHMLDCQIYGLNPWGHHLTNVLLHTATVIALFLVLAQWTGAIWRCAFVAAIFAVHPLRVESVAWVAERKDVLSGLFFVLTLAAYGRFAANLKFQNFKSQIFYGLALVCFALGLMSKPMLVTLPLILLLVDYWPLRRAESWGKLLAKKIPFFALSIAACVATVIAQQRGIQTHGSFALPTRLANALVACAVYLRQMFFPSGLAPFYPFPGHGLPPWEIMAVGAVVVGFSWIAVGQRGRSPWLFVGWFWYLIMLLPVLGIVQVGDQAHADRYTYLPEIGIAGAVTWWAAEKMKGWLLGIFGAIIIICVTAGAWKQAGYWKTDETLWRHALACTQDNYVAHFNLGNALREEGKMDEALAEYQTAVSIRSDYPQAQNNIGKFYLVKGDADEAIPYFETALKLNPDFALAHENLGNALSRKGDVADALKEFQAAEKLDPADPWAKNSLAWIRATAADPALRDGAGAVELAGAANSLSGGKNPVFLHTLAAAQAEAGNFSAAIATAQDAAALAQEQSKQRLAAQLQYEIGLYQTGKPFHVGPAPQ